MRCEDAHLHIMLESGKILLDICEVPSPLNFCEHRRRAAAAASSTRFDDHTPRLTCRTRTPDTPPRLSSPRRRALSARRPRLASPRRWRQPPTLAAVPPVTRRPAPQLAAASSTANLAAHASSPPTPPRRPRLSPAGDWPRFSALAAAPLGTPPPRLHSPPPLCTSRPSLYATLFSHGFVSFV